MRRSRDVVGVEEKKRKMDVEGRGLAGVEVKVRERDVKGSC